MGGREIERATSGHPGLEFVAVRKHLQIVPIHLLSAVFPICEINAIPFHFTGYYRVLQGIKGYLRIFFRGDQNPVKSNLWPSLDIKP
jgi:hypothetical protein